MNNYNEYFLNTYRRKKINIIGHQGSYLKSDQGDYLDMFSGLGVNALGGSHPAVISAMHEQLDKFLHLSNYFLNEPAGKMAEYLIKHTFAEGVFFSNSGTEAMEAGLKLIKKYGNQAGKSKIMVFGNGFHGRTLGALSATAQAKYQDQVAPLLPGFVVAEFNNTADFLAKFDGSFAGVILEAIQGEGGINIASQEFMDTLRSKTSESQSILLIDEIQSGIGRTGELFAFENYKIVPDLVTAAKPLGGGLPLGALLVGEKYKNIFAPGDHGSTFGGNALPCAGGLALLQIVNTPEFLSEVKSKGELLKSEILRLQVKFPRIIGSIRQMGLMLGIDILKNHLQLMQLMEDHKILVNFTRENVLRLLPPLNIKKQEILLFTNTLEKILPEIDCC